MQLIYIGTVFFLFKSGEMLLDTTVRPYLLNAVCKKHLFNNNSLCLNLHNYPDHEDSVQKEASLYFFIYRVAANVPAIVTGLFLGAWSDKNGRRLPMVFTCIGLTLSVPFYIGSMYIGHPTLAVWIILAGTFFQGLSGKGGVITMAVNCFIAEISDAKNITKHTGMLFSMNFFGNCFGAFLAGIIGWDLVPYFTVIGINGIAVIIILVFIKETKRPSTGKCSNFHKISKTCANGETDNNSETKTNPDDCELDKTVQSYRTFEGLKLYSGLFTRKRTGFNNLYILILFSVIFLSTCDVTGTVDVMLLFVSRSPYNWTKSLYSYFVSFDNILMGEALFLTLPFLSKILKLSDIKLVVIGLFCRVIRYVCTGFSTVTWTMFVYDVIGSGGSFIICIRSILSKVIEEEELGKFFSIYSVTEIAAKLIGSIVYMGIYSATVSFYPGIAFFVMGLVNLTMLIATVVVHRLFKKGQHEEVLPIIVKEIKINRNGEIPNVRRQN
ncbi:lysosomal proton-coupled steroid conjugate and bile acid symporter SLC46A3-like [Ruditapes philippinarum]|uniref:lysosomal proton-coupled steroid conjugate and bile acid symporter SLC46A3-like n=1 Tax=Ruditapes philippinarum TaxID=129788 RepID=UPI00295B708C|nr:lysosomal proton-coupled steroid conjugate and bile acid symporter SLC46A3-like [Ruditapes philippinarum]